MSKLGEESLPLPGVGGPISGRGARRGAHCAGADATTAAICCLPPAIALCGCHYAIELVLNLVLASKEHPQ
jgi:hypothetical protein